jgi:hypothetical protein
VGLLLAAAPLSAQQAAPPAPPDAMRQRVMVQLQAFEGLLQNAVKRGAEVLAQKVAEQLPGVQLTSSDPEAKGFSLPTPEGGYFFVVIVPGVRGIVPYVLQQQYNTKQPQGRPVSGRPGEQAVSPQTLPNADPMTVSPTISDGSSPGPLNADKEYSKAVSEALIDAVIDNSGGLPLKENEWLTVAAIDGVAPTPGVVSNAFGHTLYISVKGEDLIQFRQSKISRDELRKVVNVKQN